MLNLILGRSGSGKTEYMRNLLGDKAKSGDLKLLYIVPEQFSYSCERALLLEFGAKVANQIEVLSFSRLSDFINREVGGISGSKLDDADKIILLLHTLNGIQDNLEFYNLQADKTYFSKDLIKLFSEFNKQQIKPEDLKETENITLNKKLKDIKYIYNEFNSLLELNSYTDDDLITNRVINKIRESNIFSDYTICIDAFKGFTGQEFAIINELAKTSKELFISLCFDPKYLDEDDTSMIFNAVKDVVLSLDSKSEPIILSGHRTKSNALVFLEENIFSSNDEKFTEKTNDITLFEADTKYDECNFIAAKIRKLLREDGLRLSDIAVVTRHEDNYKRELLSALSRFGIEVFEDKRQPINTQPLIVYCKALISILLKKELNTKDILSLLKTELTSLKETECLELENYVFVWNIVGDDWETDFINCNKGEEEKLQSINEYRKTLIDPIIKLRSELRYDNKVSSFEISQQLYLYLEEVDIKSSLLSYARTLSGTDFEDVAIEQNRVYEMFTDILNKLATIEGEDLVTLPMFYELFCSVCEMETLGALPHGLDELTIGSADRIRLNNPKVVFVCGCIEGEFPENIKSSNLLTNNDRKIINNELELNLSPSNELAACDERFIAYSALTSSTEKLIVSYHKKSGASNELSASCIYTDIKERFENIEKIEQKDLDAYFFSETKESTFRTYASDYHKQSNENIIQYNTIKESLKGEDLYSDKFNTLNSIVNRETKEIKDKDLSRKLFGEHMGLSASRIEVYHNCPFQYFCKHGIGVYPLRRVSLDNQLRGTVVHYVLEQVLKNNSKEVFQSMSEETQLLEIKKYLEQYLSENYKGDALKDVTFKYQYNALVKTLQDVIKKMIDEFNTSNFEPIAFEYDIEESFENASLKGDIDRVDKYVAEDGNTYIRVVDYKTYIKEFRLDHVLKGLSLQMLIYLFAAKKQLDSIPAGILYYKASSMSTTIKNRDLSLDEIYEEKISKNHGSGLFLNEDEILNAMENKRTGRFYDFNTENLVTLEEIGKIEEAINEKINKMVQNLQNGLIPINPILDKTSSNQITGCKYCDYSNVCGFEGEEEYYNVVSKLDKDTVMEKLEGGDDNERIQTNS